MIDDPKASRYVITSMFTVYVVAGTEPKYCYVRDYFSLKLLKAFPDVVHDLIVKSAHHFIRRDLGRDTKYTMTWNESRIEYLPKGYMKCV